MPIDLLSDMLDLLRVQGGVFGRLNAGGCWATPLQSDDTIKFCAATQGFSWYQIEGMAAPARFTAGDVLLINCMQPLRMGHHPDALPGAADPCPAPDPQGAYQYGQGLEFSMLSGGVQVDAEHRDLLRRSLPPWLHVRHDREDTAPLARLVEQLVKEINPHGQQGRTTAISALTQLLFIQILRTYMQQTPALETGWLRVFSDRRLTAALGSMHGDPAHKWSLQKLAGVAGMSRTAFAVSFRQVMGRSPLSYLTHWRMRLASRALAAGASVAQTAAQVGYASESAFSSAFRQWSGTAPGAFRRQRRAAAQNDLPR